MVLAVLLCFTCSLSMFAGGQPDSEVSASNEIEVWHRWSGPHQEVFDEMVAAFNAQSEGVTVKAVSIPGEYAKMVSKAQAQAAAGQAPPAIFATGYFLMDYTIRTFGGADIAKIGGARAKDVFSRFEPSLLDLGKYNGTQYGLPLAISIQTLFYNADIFKEAGLDPDAPPKTWTEVAEYARVIADKTDKAPLFISTPDTWYMQALIESNGGRMLKNGKAAFDSPEAIEVMQKWQDMYEAGLIPKISYQESKRAFQGGEIAIHGISIMNLSSVKESLGDALRVAPMPTFGNKRKRQPTGGAGLVVVAKEEAQQQAAWEFLDFVASREAMDIWIKSGYVSVLKDYQPLNDPRQQAAYDQLQNAIPWTNWPGPRGLEVEGVLNEWRDKILLQGLSPEEGLRNAARQVNEML
jgi:sn-glycerol 3-phosphate transport system substrate-binding protein